MQDHRNRVAIEDDQMDTAVLALMLDDEHQRPWADDEIVREIGSVNGATDSLDRLHGAGLIHRLEGFAWATRPALAARCIVS